MNYRITPPGRIIGEIDLPASKSISNRALIIDALCPSHGRLDRLARCADTAAVQRALAAAGAHRIDIGAAGTAMRFLTAYFATRHGITVTLDGTERMRNRPIGPLADALASLGAGIEWEGRKGYPPLRVTGGTLHGGTLHIDGSMSSQYISALMMIAPVIDGGLTLCIDGSLTSRPYVEMTMRLMRQWGASVDFDGNRIVVAQGGYEPHDITVEADWSAASYWYALQDLVPGSRISLKGLSRPSVQGDSRIADIAWSLGVESSPCGVCTDLRPTIARAQTVTEDMTDTPDIAQTLAVWLCLKGIPYRLNGLHTLKIKETDRIAALQSQLLKLGYAIEAGDNFIAWNGNKAKIHGTPSISTFDDHRMAMSMALASTHYPGLIIEDAQVVEKSYPEFWQHLRLAGFKIEEV